MGKPPTNKAERILRIQRIQQKNKMMDDTAKKIFVQHYIQRWNKKPTRREIISFMWGIGIGRDITEQLETTITEELDKLEITIINQNKGIETGHSPEWVKKQFAKTLKTIITN